MSFSFYVIKKKNGKWLESRRRIGHRHNFAIDVPDLIIMKKKWDRTIEHNKLDNYFADPDLFIKGK